MRLALAALLIAASATAAAARPARCETTDDGPYPCDFAPDGRDGSFAITARGKPRYAIAVDAPGEASAFVTLAGGRAVSLPGTYRRDPKDPGCWVGDATGAKICAR